jgi:uncharacterized protein (DUF2225 family)
MINITLLRDTTRLRKYSRGSIITGPGTDIAMFSILRGDVGVFTGYMTAKVERVSMLGAGAIYIEPSTEEGRRSVTTISLSDAVILPIEKSAVIDFMRSEPEIAIEIIKELSRKSEPAVSAPVSAMGRPSADGLIAGKSDGRDKKAAVSAAGKKETVKTIAAAGQPACDFVLFPEGHGGTTLPMDNQDASILMDKTHTCPVCQQQFSAPYVRPSRLVIDSVDDDMRNHYKGIEPLYYDVLTCPHCYYSAMQDIFDKPERRRQDIAGSLSAIKDSMDAAFPALSDSDAVFARYYLALHSATVAFARNQYVTAKLLYILSRLYQDAGNEKMEEESSKRALDAFIATYENARLTPQQEQQVSVLLGELYLKQNDLKNATVFFNKAKMSGEKTSVLRRHAEDRIYDIRSMAGVHSA